MKQLKAIHSLCCKAVQHPRLLLYYLRPKKILRCFYYLQHGGIKQVSRILDERFLMGADLKLDIQVEKIISKANINDYPSLTFKEESHPLVSIIIPVYNQFDYTYSCLQSILTRTKDVSFELILADDGSSDFTAQIKQVVKQIRIVRTPYNLGFLKNCNYAASFAKGRYLMFLNNDTQVQNNWLLPLVELAEANPDIGLTGSKLIYPNGTLQEAGGILWNDGSAWNYGNGKNPAMPEYNYVKEVDYISGAAILIRKTLWTQLGGFDERYSPAYCEDSDLAFAVRKAGYRVVFQPSSVVVHFEGMSNGTDLTSGTKAYQVKNQERFYQKWKPELTHFHLEHGTDSFLTRDRSQNKKRILVIDHMVPQYDKDAGAKNVFMYTSLFQEMGLKVTFLPADFFPFQPYTSELEQAGIEVLYGNYYLKYWKEWLTEHIHYYDYIYLNRPHIAVRFMDLLKKYATGKIIYFGHDLHFLREQREYELKPRPELLKSIEYWKKLEFKLMNAADIVYVVGSYEQQVLQKELLEKIIRNIPIFSYDIEKNKAYPKAENRKDLLFVGGFKHPPNIDAVLWFAKEVFPHILIKYPDIHWYIAGSNPTDEILALNSKNITVTGFVSDETLVEYYNSCRLSVVPLRYGAGVKGKVIESIYYHCPLITTTIGAEGISTEENAFCVIKENDAEAMSKAIIGMYENYTELNRMLNKGRDYIKKYYTKECALNTIQMDIHR